MTALVERVAKALFADYVGQRIIKSSSWEYQDVWVQNGYRSLARAAIEAMREPTEKMLDAGVQEPASYGDVKEIWPAMINAALSDD